MLKWRGSSNNCSRPTQSADCDVLLVNPPWYSKDQNIWHGIKAAMPPLGLLSIAAYAEREGFRTRVIDLHVERCGIETFRAALRTAAPKVVGISMMTATAIAAHRVARIVKEELPDARVVVGGVHADAMPEECLRSHAIDVAVRGDGEETFARIAAGVALPELRGVSFRRNGERVHTPAGSVNLDLDALPLPAYHLVPMRKYHPALGASRRLPAINMVMTRGCPGKCTFCNSAETPLRVRSADLVVDEIALLRERYGIREIQFYDDTFTVMKQNTLRFCEQMKKRRLGVTWSAFARTDCFSESLAKALREGGCHQLMFGVESGDPEILERIRKPIDIDKTRWAVRVAQKAGLEVRATFMLGNPGETEESMQRTIDYAVSLRPDLALFNITTPYPGTQMFEWAKRHGYLRTEDWSEYELSASIMQLPTVSNAAVAAAYSRAHRSFYAQPGVLLRRLARIRRLSHLTDNVQAFFFIVLRTKLGRRGLVRQEWIKGKKEDFWTYKEQNSGLHSTTSDEVLSYSSSQSEINRPSLELPVLTGV